MEEKHEFVCPDSGEQVKTHLLKIHVPTWSRINIRGFKKPQPSAGFKKKPISEGYQWLNNHKSLGGEYFIPRLIQDGWYPCAQDSHLLSKRGGRIWVVALKRWDCEQKTAALGKESFAGICDLLEQFSFIGHGFINPRGYPASLNLVNPQARKRPEFSVSLHKNMISVVRNEE